MEYTNHIMKAADAQEIADAVDSGTLVKPYVALNQDTGELDFNTYEPDAPTMGIWGDDGEGTYTFQITETDTSNWVDDTYIGVIPGVRYNGVDDDANISLSYNSGLAVNGWVMKFRLSQEGLEVETYFQSGTPGTIWINDFWLDDTDPENMAQLLVSWDGSSTFEFTSSNPSVAVLSIETSDPPYPGG